MEVKKIEKVEAKPDVNIFLRKPFVSENNKENQQPNNEDFQVMLDESIDSLIQEGSSFNDTVNKIIDDTVSVRTIKNKEMKKKEKEKKKVKKERRKRGVKEHKKDNNATIRQGK